jgi:hypothetical protein
MAFLRLRESLDRREVRGLLCEKEECEWFLRYLSVGVWDRGCFCFGLHSE